MTRFAWLILAFGVITLTIVDGGYLVALPSYSASEIHNNNETKHNQERLDGPVLSVVIETFDTIERLIERHEKLLIVLATIAIAWFTRTLWAATVELSNMAKQQAVDMRESLRIGSESADAGKKSAMVAEKSLVSTQRAFVFMPRFDSNFVYESGTVHHLVLNPIWENSGGTPACNVKTWTGPVFTTPNQTIDDINIDEYAKEIIAPVVIGPKIWVIGSKVAIPIKDAMAVWRKERRLFLWTIMEYEDIFGEPRHTQVSAEVLLPEDPSKVTATTLSDNTIDVKVTGTRYNTFR